MFEEKIVKKVPGNPKPNPKEKQGYIEDLSSKTRVELLELLERQNKLLANKQFIDKLKDKGERIASFKKRLEVELKKHDKVEEACTLLSNLSLRKSNINDEIEWNQRNVDSDASDSHGDDSEVESDPLKIIVSHSGVDKLKKKSRSLRKYEQTEKNGEILSNKLVDVLSEDDSEGDRDHKSATVELPSSQSTSDVLSDTHAKTLCQRIDKLPVNNKEVFKPYCTTRSGVHPGLHVPKHVGPHWEVTAATPPPPVHGAVKLLTLQESLQLQHEQAAKLKEVQAKQASERLTLGMSCKMGTSLPNPSTRNEYRDVQLPYDSCSSADEEEHDGHNDGDDDNRDTIVYTYTE